MKNILTTIALLFVTVGVTFQFGGCKTLGDAENADYIGRQAARAYLVAEPMLTEKDKAAVTLAYNAFRQVNLALSGEYAQTPDLIKELVDAELESQDEREVASNAVDFFWDFLNARVDLGLLSQNEAHEVLTGFREGVDSVIHAGSD